MQKVTFTNEEINTAIANNAVKYYRFKDSFNYLPKEVIDELREYVSKTFKEVSEVCRIVFTENEVNCNEMEHQWEYNNVLLISTAHNESRLFPEILNLKFRAIHDYIHLSYNYGCDYEGEYNTYLVQSYGLSDTARQVLFSEIVMQASYFLYVGEFPKVQKVVLTDEHYQYRQTGFRTPLFSL